MKKSESSTSPDCKYVYTQIIKSNLQSDAASYDSKHLIENARNLIVVKNGYHFGIP